jgi:gliding motility-associated-like protein
MNHVRIFVLTICIVISGFWVSAQCLVINEIMINPDSPFDGTGMPNTAEWVELHNTCATPIDAGCFVITDGDFTLTIPEGTTIAPDEYFTIGSVNSGAPIDLNWGTCNCTTNTAQVGIFTNSGEQLALIDDSGQLVDGVFWGSGQFPVSITSGGVNCAMQNIVFSNGALFTNIPYTNQQACTVSLDCNGSWAETCGAAITPDANNQIGSPVITFQSSVTSICAGGCVDFSFTGSGASGWNWTFNGANTAIAEAENPTSICYNIPGIYDVTLSIDGACGSDSYTAMALIEVLPNTAPTITTPAPPEICQGEEAELLSLDGTVVSWYHDGELLGTGASWLVNESGDYWATQGTSGCDVPSNTLSLTILPTPIIALSAPNTTACEGESITITATEGMDAYTWSQDENILSNAVSNTLNCTSSGSYNVIALQSGCSASSSINITFNPLPSGTINPTGAVSACENSPTPLMCDGIFDQVQWLLNGNALPGNTNSTYTPAGSGIYSAMVSANGCSSATNAVNYTVVPPPSFTWNNPAELSTCLDQLSIQVNTSSPVQWYLNDTPIVGATNPLHIATTSGTYACMIDPNAICPAESPSCLIVLNVPLNIQLTTTTDTLCIGESAILTANYSEGVIAWSDGSLGDSIEVNASDLYWAQVAFGDCVASDTLNITFVDRPFADAGEDLISDCGVAMLIDAVCDGTCHWEYLQTTAPFSQPNYLPSPDQSTTYILIADNGFCQEQDTLFIWADCVHVYVPNAFTPDGDGINDVLEVFTSGIDHIRFNIYDRWGTQVYYSEDSHPVWSGGLTDYYVPDGVYVWRLEAIDIHLQGFIREGSILIAR